MKRSLAFSLALVLGLLVHSGTSAKQPDEHDALDLVATAEASTGPAQAGGEERAPGHGPNRDHRVDLPSFVWATRPSRTPAAAAALSSIRPEQAARQHLREHASLYRLTDDEARSVALDSVHDTGRGAIIVSFRRAVGGIEVFRDEVRLAMDRGHELVAISGYVTGSASEPAGRGSFERAAAEAIAVAFADLTGEDLEPGHLRRAGGRPGGYDAYELTPVGRLAHGAVLAQPVRAKRVYFRLADRLEAGYYVELDVTGPGEVDSVFYSYVISAEGGDILFRRNLTADAAFSYRVWADPSGDRIPLDSPYGSAATPHPTGLPDGSQVGFVAPILVTLQNGPISTNDPWLAPAATATNGNNADAYADIVSPDGFLGGDLRADLTGPLSFDRTYNTGLTPNANTTQQKAAVTQLFYDVNLLHDWFYDSGFNEVSRNAQADNYGRGGVAGDSMRAEAQDFGGRNNANMSTPADGGRPRMQMYIFDASGPSALTVNTPASISGSYQVGIAAFGPTSFTTTGDVALVDDGAGTVSDGCETPFANAGAIAGKLAFIDRGTCSFKLKVRNAQLNGAIGALIANNQPGGTLTMGNDPNVTATITTPSLMISQENGATIRAELGGVVNATLERQLAVDHDGTIDNQIVAHEWGHYISHRLVGNSAGLSNSQGNGMGEGWGDFHALLITVRPEDELAPTGEDFSGVYALAAYAVGGSQGHYFGIRRYPYSTDLAKDPLTFRHVANGNPLPSTAPVAGGAAGTNNSQVHNTGEIWATMLWDCYASLLRDALGPSPRLTFAEAQQRMRDYLVAAYKLTPNAPTILEARDAILASALAGDPVDHELFLRAFARRGAGRGAVAPDRSSVANVYVRESIVASDLYLEGFQVDDTLGCDADGTLDAGETVQLEIALRHAGPQPLGGTSATITSASSGVSFPSGGALVFPAVTPGGTTTASVPAALAAGAGIRTLDFTLTYDNVDLEIPGPQDLTFSHRGNADDVAGQSAGDDVESESPVWTVGANAGLDTSLPWRRVSAGTTDHRWLGPASRLTSDHYLVSPPLQVAATGSFSFSFRHRFLFEFAAGPPATYFDGGVIEISTNGGAWSDVVGAPFFVNPGYTGGLASGGGNPIEGRQAYSGNSPGYPAFNTVTVNLGTSLQGQTVEIRFRVATDIGTDNYGWEIDDIVFNNLTNLPFRAVVPESDACTDSDGDSFLDPVDCAPFDGSRWSVPGAVSDLTLTASTPTGLSWSTPAAPGGLEPILYDVLRSETAGSFAAAVCMESDDLDLAAADPAVPPVIYYYLVRTQNSCGENLGAESNGTPRTGIGCP